jgi:hypothetical protein
LQEDPNIPIGRFIGLTTVVVALDSGWEWKERREAQLYVSQTLLCAGFLIFVYDGDYWGYEFFNHGVVLDQFVQESSDAHFFFAERLSQGNPGLVAEYLPFLDEADVAAYLVQSHDWQIPQGANTKARPGDDYNRFDECAILDFLGLLGVQLSVENDYVQLASPRYRSLWKEHKR